MAGESADTVYEITLQVYTRNMRMLHGCKVSGYVKNL